MYITVVQKACGRPLKSSSCMVDFHLYASWGICIAPRTSWRICILPRMYILGNVNIAQDHSELQDIMAIKSFGSSCHPSYNVFLSLCCPWKSTETSEQWIFSAKMIMMEGWNKKYRNKLHHITTSGSMGGAGGRRSYSHTTYIKRSNIIY